MRAVFIDRDGTMGGGHTVEYPWEYRPYPGTAEAFRLLRGHGFAPIIFTNPVLPGERTPATILPENLRP